MTALISNFNQAIISHPYLQTSFKKVNDLSKPYISKLNEISEPLISKYSLVIVEKYPQILDSLAKSRKLLDDLDSKLENYCETLKTDKKEEKNKEEEEGCELQLENQNKVKKILHECNTILTFWVAKVWLQLKNKQLDLTKAKEMFFIAQEQLKTEFSKLDGLAFRRLTGEQIENIKIFVEMSRDFLSQHIWNPSIELLQIKIQKNKENVTLLIENWKNLLKEKKANEILGEAKEKFIGLKNVTINVIKEKIEISFSKNTWKLHKEEIQQFIKYLKELELQNIDLKGKGKEIVQKNKETTMLIYQKTIEKIKNQKEVAKEKFNDFVKAFNERKMALRGREEVESQSTDHEYNVHKIF
jgi:hypothetical protein